MLYYHTHSNLVSQEVQMLRWSLQNKGEALASITVNSKQRGSFSIYYNELKTADVSRKQSE